MLGFKNSPQLPEYFGLTKSYKNIFHIQQEYLLGVDLRQASEPRQVG